VRPEKSKELSQTFLSIVEHVKNESGCLNADFYQNIENENKFLMLEEWATQKDSDDHLRSDIFTVLIGAGSLMRSPPKIMIHTVKSSRRLEAEHQDSWTRMTRMKGGNNE
jgi:quinol monooxygenase YgiN